MGPTNFPLSLSLCIFDCKCTMRQIQMEVIQCWTDSSSSHSGFNMKRNERKHVTQLIFNFSNWWILTLTNSKPTSYDVCHLEAFSVLNVHLPPQGRSPIFFFLKSIPCLLLLFIFAHFYLEIVLFLLKPWNQNTLSSYFSSSIAFCTVISSQIPEG